MRRRDFLPLLPLAGLAAAPDEEQPDFVCPMDKGVRSKQPGRCPLCGMKLLPGIPEPVEYPVRMTVSPRHFEPGRSVDLTFEVLAPDTGRRVREFEAVHEKLFHLFLVSSELDWFAHEHPEPLADGTFRFQAAFPRAGAFRLLCDFYPRGGTPQAVAKTIIAPGASWVPARPAADLAPKRAANLEVRLSTEPLNPLAGQRTLLFFDLSPPEGLEPWLGAAGHLLVASADLIDMIHTHPAAPALGGRLQFNLILPRPGVHRLWLQAQRSGVLNTAAFNMPVGSLE